MLAEINPTDADFEGKIKLLDKQFPAEGRKTFMETDAYKQVEKQSFDNKERVTMANNLYDQLLKMKAAIDARDLTLAANIGKTGVMKSVNSMQGKDAVSGGEQSTRYQDLLSLPDILIQSGDKSMLKTIMSRMAMAKQKGDNKTYNSALSEWNALATQALDADPVNFYRTAYKLHNAAVDTASRNVDNVIRASSPYHARQLQAEKPLRLPPEANPVSQSTSTQFTQTAPVGTTMSGGTMSGVSGASGGTMSSGAGQAFPMQGVSPAAIQEARRRGLIK